MPKTIEEHMRETSARADRFMEHFGVKENGHVQTGYFDLMKFVEKEVELALTEQREELVKEVRNGLVTVSGTITEEYKRGWNDCRDDIDRKLSSIASLQD